MKRIKVRAAAGRKASWYDESRADTFEVAGEQQVLARSVSGSWLLRGRDDAEADPVDADHARRLLADAGLSTAIIDRPAPAPRRTGRVGRPPAGVRVEVRVPQDELDVVDQIAAGLHLTRADIVRDAILERVEIHRLGLDDWLQQRSDHSRVPRGIAHELSTLRDILSLELAAHAFTPAQLCLVADALNGSMTHYGVGRITADEVSDAIANEQHLPAKWGVDPDELTQLLSALGPAADAALRDAIATFWNQGSADLDPGEPHLWRELGLAVTEA